MAENNNNNSGSKGGFGKSLLGLFVEIDEKPKQDKNDNNVVVDNTNQQMNQDFLKFQTNNNQLVVKNDVIIDTTDRFDINVEELNKFKSYFNDLFKGLNMPGPDFFEFYQMFNSESMLKIPDNTTRLIATFSALSYQGLSKEKLTSSVEHYVNAIMKDKVGYTDVINEKVKTESLVKNNTIESNKKLMLDIDAQISELITKRESLDTQNIELNQSISEASVIHKNKLKTYDMVSNELLSNIKNTLNLIQTNL